MLENFDFAYLFLPISYCVFRFVVTEGNVV